MNSKSTESQSLSILLDNKFILREKLGSGSFGQIFTAISKEDGSMVAIKIEQRSSSSITTLIKEAKILGELQGKKGFPALFGQGKEADFSYLALELLGKDLEKLLKICDYKFSLKTCLLLMDQMLARIEALHQTGHIHRDIKPENFCINKDCTGSLYLIDFGLARSYKDSSGKHIPCIEKKGLVGTARYASVNSHLGLEQSRRDDLESIAYTVIYLLKGKLPWQNLKATSKNEKYTMISNMKISTPVHILCKDLPTEFVTYLSYVKGLNFEDSPDYKYLKGLFRTLFVKNGYDFDYDYDWINILYKGTPYSLEKAPKRFGKILVKSATKKPQLEHKINDEKKEANTPIPSKFEGSMETPTIKKDTSQTTYKVVLKGERKVPESAIVKGSADVYKNVDENDLNFKKNLPKGQTLSSRKDKDTRVVEPGHLDVSDVFSGNSSKKLNVSKLEDDEIPIEITFATSPSTKILETKPLAAKTKDSYYTTRNLETLLPQACRNNARKRTFIRAYSQLPIRVIANKAVVVPVITTLRERGFREGKFLLLIKLILFRGKFKRKFN